MADTTNRVELLYSRFRQHIDPHLDFLDLEELELLNRKLKDDINKAHDRKTGGLLAVVGSLL